MVPRSRPTTEEAEKIGETRHRDAQECSSIGRMPILLHCEPLASLDNNTTLLRGVQVWINRKSGSENKSIDLVLDAVVLNTVFGVSIETFAVRVDQRNVGLVESLKIFIMEGRPLAPASIPCFQLFSSMFVFDNLVDVFSQGLSARKI